MKQLIRSFKTGELGVADVPAPALRSGGILVRTGASLLSVGTERMVVKLAQKNLLAKAKARPDRVRQVIDKARREGLLTTLDAVRSQLDTPLSLGYSCAGTVLEVGSGTDGFRIGDRVACAGGGYACHAEVVFVPTNLAAKVPHVVSIQEAAFTTLGAIALQGVRIADLELGSNVAIIGLGLVGQLTVQLVKAAGCRVIGIDLDPERVRLACELGADTGVVRGRDDVVAAARRISGDHGVDAAVITAATAGNDPVELAGEISRDKGRVVVVGAVGMDIPRRAYYEKELDVRLSRSYGPGRYDAEYEEKGHDYPYGYVRWTEQRNMEAFLALVAEGKVDVERLITHRFPIGAADRAYDLITGGRQEQYLGILLTYDAEVDLGTRVEFPEAIRVRQKAEGEIGVGVIGAGNFARGVLLPNIRKVPGIRLRGVATATGVSAKHAGERYGFEYGTCSYKDILDDPAVTAVCIATRHDLHASLVVDALRSGKDVFTEKPLASSLTELREVVTAWQQAERRVMVGFNRRFAPFSVELKQFLEGIQEPLLANYRVNAGFIDRDHWTQDLEVGGGRIIGEVCHFVDLLQHLIGAKPVRVYARALPNDGRYNDDNACITLDFADGSLGTIAYTANGDKAFGKERIEVFGGGRVAVLDDFRRLELVGQGNRKVRRSGFRQDKGHRREWDAFAAALRNGTASPIPFEEAVATTLTTFAILDSLKRGTAVAVDPQILDDSVESHGPELIPE